MLRFLFFHYVLFAGSPGAAPAVAEEALASADFGPGPFARAAEPLDEDEAEDREL